MPARRTTDEGLVVYGVNAVLGLLRSAQPPAQVFVRGSEMSRDVAAEVARSGIRLIELSASEMERLAAGGRHQGVAARVSAFGYVSLEEIMGAPGRGAVVLDGIMDPRNLGAIVRSARAAGVRGVVLPRDRSASVTTAVVTASAGTVFGLPVARVTNLARAMQTLKDAGMWLVGLAARAERSLVDLPDMDDPVVVVGAEGEGLRRLVRERCDFLARIPMAGDLESLNASVAVGIALYELAMRRRDGV
jgi:23S rRNA (guanosine2251-2'-O)-methyltransferase